ncbi:MAG: 16S rRNA (cytidine(1402)-2'-O)-methyltransferase, partial [Gammaproteobacteria bacterium]|nr:16S rRNA (cytidine(1402)-2'-O)-methyltransferase [Gammaproteobacteria bacterium]
MRALHDHNERAAAAALAEQILRDDMVVALISDAGTPLVSDPGFVLVREALARHIAVTAVPGPAALIMALVLSGLPAERFVFEGFLPPRAGKRRERLSELAFEPRTLVFYEAPHRLEAMLADVAAACGDERRVAVARELTKRFEHVYRGTVREVRAEIGADPHGTRGEMVVVVEGGAARDASGEIDTLLRHALKYLSVRDAASLVAEISGQGRNAIYQRCLELSGSRPHT